MTETLLTRADFLGDWRLSRRIDDRLAGSSGVFEGTARITAKGASEARYAETGLLRLGDSPPLQAERQYLWTFEGRDLAIRFADGRDFMRFTPAGLVAEAVHGCAPDTYRVVHDFRAWPRWRADWTVTGPRKDYCLHTEWCRP